MEGSPPVHHQPPREIGDNVAASISKTVVVARIRRRRACYAGDCTEIFVHGAQVMIRQVFESRPGHGLEEISPERSWNTACINDSCWTCRMEVVQVHARPHDQNKIGKGMASFRHPGFIGCQVARDDVRCTWYRCTEISAAAQ